jgi:hypothetical protein
MKPTWDVIAICQVSIYLGQTEADTEEDAIEAFLEAELTVEDIASAIEPVAYTAVQRANTETGSRCANGQA